MSKMADFYSKVMTDKALLSKLKDILGDKHITDASDADLEKIGALAKEAGFEITLAEAKEYLSANETVVSDEALDAVAGGGVVDKIVKDKLKYNENTFPKDLPKDREPEIHR